MSGLEKGETIAGMKIKITKVSQKEAETEKKIREHIAELWKGIIEYYKNKDASLLSEIRKIYNNIKLEKKNNKDYASKWEKLGGKSAFEKAHELLKKTSVLPKRKKTTTPTAIAGVRS